MKQGKMRCTVLKKTSGIYMHRDQFNELSCSGDRQFTTNLWCKRFWLPIS